jgi:sortase A
MATTTERSTLGDPPSHRRRRRPWGFWLGIGLVLAGLAMLGWVAWQFWGTNIVSRHRQQQIAQQLQHDWRTAKGDRLDPRFVAAGGASAVIRIPRFGRSYAVPVLEGVGPDVLAQGFGHFPQSADPGQVGNYALAAHRVTHGEPLRNMPELRPGDKVVVQTARAIYTYVLDTNPNALIVPFTQTWVIAPHPRNPDTAGVEPPNSQRLITLTTCSELFHTDNRMIAFGHLVARRSTG